MKKSCTLEEIAEMHGCNENFRGTRANFKQIQLYQAVKGDLVGFMERCNKVQRVEGFDPNRREKHAIICMDLKFAAILDKQETAELTAIMNKADGVIFTAVNNHVRITFEIKNIWDR